MRESRAWRAAVAALGLSVAVGGTLAAQEDEAGIPLGALAPAVTIEDLDGKPVDLARFIGAKPVLIEFWAAWCPLCRALAPALKTAQARYGDRVSFVAVAVAVNETRESVRRHLRKDPMPFPFLWDATGAATRAFQAPSTSYVVMLDKHHRVVYTGVGADQDLAAGLTKVAAN